MDLKSFLTLLQRGISRKDVPRKHIELFESLVLRKAVKCKEEFCKLDGKYRIGTVDISRNGTGYLSVLGGGMQKDLLIDPDDLGGAGKGDIVLAKRIFGKAGRAKARVVEILKRAFDITVAYTKAEAGSIQLCNLKTDLPVTAAISQKALHELGAGAVLKIDSHSGMVREVLGNISDPKVDEKISLALYDKKEAFDEACEREARSFGDHVDKNLYPEREDLTHLAFCTIDPPDAKDFDDAIYFDVEKRILYVAIADVSHYVSAHSALDKEAASRGFTIYFPHKSIPMLPRSLSENICSLKPNEDRLAMVWKIAFAPDSTEVVSETLIEAVIHSRRRYTYDTIDAFLAGDFREKTAIDDEILAFLLPLHTLLGKIRKKRLETGCAFRSTEIRMQLDENQNLIGLRVETETPSHALIEDAMLLANKAAAKALDKGIFRTHEPPSVEKMEALLDDLAVLGIYTDEKSEDLYRLIRVLQRHADEKGIREEVDRLIIRAQQQAIYDHQSRGHFGLGFEHYTHFTSPIRRYSDLVVHRLLRAILQNDEKMQRYILRNIDVTAARISELEREAAKVEWDFMDRKYARYADAHKNREWKARVVDDESTPIARFDEGLLTGARLFLLDHEVALFSDVLVEITDVHIPQAKIIGRITQRLERHV